MNPQASLNDEIRSYINGFSIIREREREKEKLDDTWLQILQIYSSASTRSIYLLSSSSDYRRIVYVYLLPKCIVCVDKQLAAQRTEKFLVKSLFTSLSIYYNKSYIWTYTSASYHIVQ